MRGTRSTVLAAVLCALVAASVSAQTPAIEGLRTKYPPNEDALVPGFHWAPRFSRALTMPARERVPVRVDWPDVPGFARSPVTFGVLFADQTLASVDHARLITADGTTVPAQIASTATGWRRDGSVRWALISATLDRETEYFVEYGTQVTARAPSGMTVTETDAAITVDTGPLQVSISRTRPTLLDAATVEERAVVTPLAAAANLPVVVGGDGTRYPASADGLQVSFVRRGPLETIVRREG
jgi:hypothetical protein